MRDKSSKNTSNTTNAKDATRDARAPKWRKLKQNITHKSDSSAKSTNAKKSAKSTESKNRESKNLESTSAQTALNPRQNPRDMSFLAWCKYVWKVEFITRRIKAFITDLFMIYTPILYIATYVVLGGAQNFRENQAAIFVCIMIYAVVCAVFIAVSGQTPGLRFVGLKLVKNSQNVESKSAESKNIESKNLDSSPSAPAHAESSAKSDDVKNSAESSTTNDKNSDKVGFWRAWLRVMMWVASTGLVVGLVSVFFSRNHRFLHDFVADTKMCDVSHLQAPRPRPPQR